MRKIGLVIGIVVVLMAAHAQAQQHYPPQNPGPNPGAILGGLLGVLRSLPQQPSPGYVQVQPQAQPVAPAAPDPKVQAQIDEERRQAAVDAAAKVKQRQQAADDAKARQKLADQKADAAAKAKLKKLQADPALVAVLGADPRDIVALIVGKDTKGVIRNMEGNPIFQSVPVACFPFGGLTTQPGSPEMRFLSVVMADIMQKGGSSSTTLIPTVCSPSEIIHYDLVIFSSAQVADGSLDGLTAITDALHNRSLVAFGTFTVASFNAAEQAKADAAQAEEARKAAERQAAIVSFQTRDGAVISAIHLDTPTTVVCLLVPDVAGVRYLLKRSDSPFASLINTKTTILEVPTADAMFIDLKKRDCVAAMAPTETLKTVLAALTRDGITAEVESGIFDNEKLAGWKELTSQDLLAEQEAQAQRLKKQREADALQQAADSQRQALEAERQKNDEVARQARIQDMRKLVASKANAIVDGITDQLRNYMETVRTEIANNQIPSRQPMAGFLPWSQQYSVSVKEGWEFQSITATVEDYGRAQWMQRTIEAISVRVEFPMLNRVVGQKGTSCVDFIWINDEEFGFRRNLMTVSCKEYDAAFKTWSDQNNFASQWKLLQ